jgi:hypothetical protein
MLLITQVMIPIRKADVKTAVKNLGNHDRTCCDVGCVGTAGITMTSLTTVASSPVMAPATMKGIRYRVKF